MKRLLSFALICAVLCSCIALSAPADVDAMADRLTLADTSHLILNKESGYIEKIDGVPTVAGLKDNFVSEITVKSADGALKEDDASVATDDVVSTYDDSLKALIYGDCNRDGGVNISDASSVLKKVAGWDGLDINTAAADVNADGNTTIADAAKLMKYIAGWGDISLGNVRMVFDNAKLTAENEDADIDMYFNSSMCKTGRSDTENTGYNSYKMKLAKSETESCQVLLTTASNKSGLTIHLSDFLYEYGEYTLKSSVNFEYYFDFGLYLTPSDRDAYKGISDYYPEVLLPGDAPFELMANRSQGFMLNVTSDENSPAGMYKAVLEIKNAEGETVKTADVYAYVWDFTLPVTPYSESAFGLGSFPIYSALNLHGGDDSKTFREYYEFLLDHNISGSTLPYDIMDERAEKYMSDPRVTSFSIYGFGQDYAGDHDEEAIKSRYDKIKKNDEWFNKSYFYTVDEPAFSGLFLVKDQYDWLQSFLGDTDFHVVVPLSVNTYPYAGDDPLCPIDAVEYITPYLDIWCPISQAFEPQTERGLWQGRRATKEYGEFTERYEKRRQAGNKMWWYVCIAPEFPYPNFFTFYNGNIVRTVLWQQFMYDIDGLLYYATQMHWERRMDRFDFYDYGDGLLLYLGEMFGYTGPCASWRLSQIRDGFDDFDYLRIAEELYGTEAVLEVVNTVTTGMRRYADNPAVMESARDRIAEMIVYFEG